METQKSEKATLTIIRKFNAPKSLVFQAFATPEAMGEWWGPSIAKMTVVNFDFRPQGIFHYKMEYSAEQILWGKFVYGNIEEPDLIEFTNAFSDENGNLTKAAFAPNWPLEIFNRVTLSELNGQTTLILNGYPVNPSELETSTFIEMQPNVTEGFNATFDQLERYVNAALTIRKELKTTKKARTSTYLNFAGNTEEAFLFYKSVFGTEFNGGKFQRFGDIPATEGQPPLSEEVKKMILHIELPILGGHILMATDAPESMGFFLKRGDNMHINLEPESREETKRLFEALSEGGNITMPLEDMFFGAYYGSLTDKYGINWMLHFSE